MGAKLLGSRVGATDVRIVPSVLAAAIGAELAIAGPLGEMIVDVGGGTTEIAVISLSGIGYYHEIPTGSEDMDTAIQAHFERVHKLAIGERTAEGIKIGLDGPMSPRTKAACRLSAAAWLRGYPGKSSRRTRKSSKRFASR
jgi:rod shape-determining protein MreB